MIDLYLGKGVAEPCPPYRTAYVFGAPLGAPDATNWNCKPVIVEPTVEFDLTNIPLNREAVCALLTVSPTLAGTYTVTFRWVQESTGRTVFEGTGSKAVPAGSFFYGVSYIAHYQQEINSNGWYRCKASWAGPDQGSMEIRFHVTGLAEVPPPPTPVGAGLRGLAEGLEAVGLVFYSIYIHVLGWIWPFYLAAEPFYQVSALFINMAAAVSEAATAMDSIIQTIAGMLTWEGIKKALIEWLPGLEGVISWFSDWWTQVKAKVDEWWSGVTSTVHGWIDVATEGFTALKAAWDEFWKTTFPNLINWTGIGYWWNTKVREVTGLIDTAFTTAAPFWAGWADVRADVLKFLSDPLEWLWGKFADWFLGPEG